MNHRRLAVAFVLLAVFLPGAWLQGQAPQSGRPQFETGIDIVTVDVTVLGRDGSPVTKLQPDDFALTVDGRPRPIHSVRLVTIGESAAAPTAPAEPSRPAAPPLAPRHFVLVIDREHIPVGEGQPMLAAAAKFVDTLAPTDRIALWTTAQNATTIGFSEDREALKRRLRLSVGTYRESFGPWMVGRDEAIKVSDNVQGALESIDSTSVSATPGGTPRPYSTAFISG